MIVQSLNGTSGEAFKGVYVLLKPFISQAVGEMYVCEKEGLILPPAHCLAIPQINPVFTHQVVCRVAWDR